MKHKASALTLGCFVALGCSRTTSEEPAQPGAKGPGAPAGAAAASLTVTSTAFAQGGAIDKRFTCDGQDVSPPLAWSEPPTETKSFAVVVEDPDAPDPNSPKRKTFIHWVVYGMPSDSRVLSEATKTAPAGARDGKNDFGHLGYGGPCPPSGQHRYVFKVYALDIPLPDLNKPHASELDRAMNGHVLAEGRLVGTYGRPPGPRS